MVSAMFGIEKTVLMQLYSSSDPYNTNMNTRAMWKYAAAKGVNSTPDNWINGVRFDGLPTTPADWVKVLQSVYDS